MLNFYQRIAYRLLGKRSQKSLQKNRTMGRSLLKGRISIRPDVYFSTVLLNAIVVASAAALLVVLFLVLYGTTPDENPMIYVILIPLPLLLAALVYTIGVAYPELVAGSRASDINYNLPYALNYIAALSAAGVTPDTVFESLSTQKVYGQVAYEASLIHRDLSLLGKDTITSLKDALDRTPSIKMQDFLQGAITTITSGGDLKVYFRAKADQFMAENVQAQKSFLETLGVMAESFVTVVVAAPLLLIIMLSVMMMVGGSVTSSVTFAYMVIFIMLPVSQAGFALAIRYMKPG
ncbi:MAG: type II secretion system F family protein [Candidatus Thermoplasmatota archaeon]|nr:type II secretion system F family protein [Candidatus Thermoplasmatota archaeon]